MWVWAEIDLERGHRRHPPENTLIEQLAEVLNV
jgi:hypothetical protein